MDDSFKAATTIAIWALVIYNITNIVSNQLTRSDIKDLQNRIIKVEELIKK